MRNVTLLTVILVLFIITVQPLWAQGIVTPKNTYRLEADEVFGADNVSFTARGNVSLEFKNSVITADEATYFPQSKTLNATGNVTIHDDFQELKADVVTYDLNT
ncbi:MAG: hypothetical protein LBH05_03080, partial [Deferribacteraceae bacterium]|nr:hypothetical protein [Deferribacteraceae bacterium]